MYQNNYEVKRNIKVSAAVKTKGDYFNRVPFIIPKIILQGNYLTKANFHPADMVEVILKKGKFILKKYNSQET